jgi:hypothetical protein
VRRRDIGVAVLALSAAYSVVDLLGWLHPVLLRMRIHEGPRRTLALLLGSLTFKTAVLASGILLAFWPERPGRDSRS